MILTGVVRLGRDVELRDANGQKVCNLAGAYNYGRAQEGGGRPTQWIDVSLWGKLAESLAPFLKKGREVWLTCEDVHVEMGARQDGTSWNKLVGRVQSIQLVGPRDQAGAAPAAPAAAPRPSAAAPRPAPAPAAGGDISF